MFTNKDINPNKQKNLKTYMKSILSDSLIVNVQSIDENINKEKDIYLFKKDLLFKHYFDKSRSKNNLTFKQKIPLNKNLESQTLNKLIET